MSLSLPEVFCIIAPYACLCVWLYQLGARNGMNSAMSVYQILDKHMKDKSEEGSK